MDDVARSFFKHCPGLFFVANGEGSLIHASDALRARFSAQLGEAPSLANLTVPAHAQRITDFLAALSDAGASATCSFHVPDADQGTTKVRCQATRDDAGAIHGTVEEISLEDEKSRISEILLETIMNTLDIVLWAVDSEGVFVFHDGKALATAGLTPGQFLGMNLFELYPPDMQQPVNDVFTEGKPSRYIINAHGVHWDTRNIPLKNASGEVEYCAGLTLDVSSQVRTEEELTRQVQTISEQQDAIYELSAPVLKVWDQVLAVPLIGVMDSGRLSELSDRLLSAVSRAGVRFAILDLTGVESLDTAITSDILRLLSSLHLLGVQGMVSGISPQVAQTMVGLGVRFGNFETHKSLREALRKCMRSLAT